MLFLAVFCGFLAENQREHIVEKSRAKQYMRSFYDDLHNNLVIFARIIQFNEEKKEALDNINACYDSTSKTPASTSCLINLIKASSSFITVSFSNGTIDQLKNAGGLRLLRKTDRDNVIAYDKHVRDYLNMESTIVQSSQDIVRNQFSRLLDFQANRILYPDSAFNSQPASLQLRANKEQLNEFFNDLFRYKRAMEGQAGWIEFLTGKTQGLIGYLETNYHFTN